MKCLRSKKRLNAADYTTRKGTRRSEKAKVSEEALLSRSSKAKKPMNACVHTYTKSQTPSTRRRGPGWRIHGSVEDRGKRVFITNVKGTFLGMSESEEASKRR